MFLYGFREIADDDAKIGKKSETRARKDEKFACHVIGYYIEESIQAGAHIGVDASERRSEQEAVDKRFGAHIGVDASERRSEQEAVSKRFGAHTKNWPKVK